MTSKTPIDVLVINLDRRTDRLGSLRQRLDDLNLGFHRISAVDGRSVPESELAVSRKSGPIGPMQDTTRACTASHVKAWRHIIASGARYMLVLEDDVVLDPAIASALADDAWIPAGIDLIKLEKFAPLRPSKVLAGRVLATVPPGPGVIRRIYSRHTGAAAYILSRRGAEIALSGCGEFDVPVDHLLFNETVSRLCARLRPAIMVPPLAWQDIDVGFGSDIARGKSRRPAPQGTGRPRKKLATSLRRAMFELRLVPLQLARILIGQARIITLRTPQASGRVVPSLMRKLFKRR